MEGESAEVSVATDEPKNASTAEAPVVEKPEASAVYDYDDESDELPLAAWDKKEPENKEAEAKHPRLKKEQEAEKGKAAASKDAPDFDDALLDRAAQVGLSQEEVGEYEDAVSLERAIKLLEKRLPAKDTAAEKTGKEQPKPDEKTGPQEFAIDLDEVEFHPALVKQLKGLHEHYEGRIKEMSAQLQHVIGYLTQKENEAFEGEIDGLMAGLGEEYHDLIGAGRGRDLDRTGEPFKNRLAVLEHMDTTAAGYRTRGWKVPPTDELFRRAVKAVFSDRDESITRKKISASLAKRNGQRINRPTQRDRATSEDPESDAKHFVRDFLASAGEEARDDDEPLI